MTDTVTIEVDKDAALIAHVQQLERTITKRNQRIAQLEQIVDGLPPNSEVQRAYKRGWQDCADRLGAHMAEATRAIETLRREGRIESQRRIFPVEAPILTGNGDVIGGDDRG